MFSSVLCFHAAAVVSHFSRVRICATTKVGEMFSSVLRFHAAAVVSHFSRVRICATT